MGIIKGCLKAAGTVALGATGIVSKVLEETSNTVGFTLGSELFNATKEASFNGIRSMWDGDNFDQIEHTVLKADVATEGAGRRKMAETAKKAANIAKQNGDMEKYEFYMTQYEQYRD